MTRDLGPTGKYPKGKLNETDEGQLNMALGIENGKLVLAFGTEVAWLGFDKRSALALAEALIEKAKEIE